MDPPPLSSSFPSSRPPLSSLPNLLALARSLTGRVESVPQLRQNLGRDGGLQAQVRGQGHIHGDDLAQGSDGSQLRLVVLRARWEGLGADEWQTCKGRSHRSNE